MSKQCGCKQQFWTREQADYGAIKIARQSYGILHSYECPECEFYHVGHVDLEYVKNNPTENYAKGVYSTKDQWKVTLHRDSRYIEKVYA